MGEFIVKLEQSEKNIFAEVYFNMGEFIVKLEQLFCKTNRH